MEFAKYDPFVARNQNHFELQHYAEQFSDSFHSCKEQGRQFIVEHYSEILRKEFFTSATGNALIHLMKFNGCSKVKLIHVGRTLAVLLKCYVLIFNANVSVESIYQSILTAFASETKLIHQRILLQDQSSFLALLRLIGNRYLNHNVVNAVKGSAQSKSNRLYENP